MQHAASAAVEQVEYSRVYSIYSTIQFNAFPSGLSPCIQHARELILYGCTAGSDMACGPARMGSTVHHIGGDG